MMHILIAFYSIWRKAHRECSFWRCTLDGKMNSLGIFPNRSASKLSKRWKFAQSFATKSIHCKLATRIWVTNAAIIVILQTKFAAARGDNSLSVKDLSTTFGNYIPAQKTFFFKSSSRSCQSCPTLAILPQDCTKLEPFLAREIIWNFGNFRLLKAFFAMVLASLLSQRTRIMMLSACYDFLPHRKWTNGPRGVRAPPPTYS